RRLINRLVGDPLQDPACCKLCLIVGQYVRLALDNTFCGAKGGFLPSGIGNIESCDLCRLVLGRLVALSSCHPIVDYLRRRLLSHWVSSFDTKLVNGQAVGRIRTFRGYARERAPAQHGDGRYGASRLTSLVEKLNCSQADLPMVEGEISFGRFRLDLAR